MSIKHKTPWAHYESRSTQPYNAYVKGEASPHPTSMKLDISPTFQQPIFQISQRPQSPTHPKTATANPQIYLPFTPRPHPQIPHSTTHQHSHSNLSSLPRLPQKQPETRPPSALTPNPNPNPHLHERALSPSPSNASEIPSAAQPAARILPGPAWALPELSGGNKRGLRGAGLRAELLLRPWVCRLEVGV